jgi:hypothetical protein
MGGQDRYALGKKILVTHAPLSRGAFGFCKQGSKNKQVANFQEHCFKRIFISFF